MQHKNGGFTLIELMAAIGVIAILAGGVIASLEKAKTYTHLKDAETVMHTARAAAQLCVLRNSNLNAPDAANFTCANSTDKWPNIAILARGWTYNAAYSPDVSNRTFSFAAQDGSGNSITCTEKECKTSP